ncbi:hypothetical protein EMCRGX_G023042 [Ephydatia muelleri]
MDGSEKGVVELRGQLKAQQAVCAKLKLEKNKALQTLQEATENIAKLKQELELRDKMFQDFWEMKEKELSELRKINQDLEKRLHSLVHPNETVSLLDQQRDNISATTGKFAFASGMPQLPAGQVVEALSKWEGMEDTLALFDERLAAEKNAPLWKSGSPWCSPWKFCLRVFISTTADVKYIADTYIKDYFPTLVQQCLDGGCTILPVYCEQDSADRLSLSESDYMKFRCSEVDKSDIFVSFLGSYSSDSIKPEIEHGYLNNPNLRPAVFVFFDFERDSAPEPLAAATLRLKQRVKKTAVNAKVISCLNEYNTSLKELNDELQRLLKDNFVVMEPVEAEDKMERIGLLGDMRVEQEQVELLNSALQGVSSPIGKDQVFELLEEHLAGSGPATPLLLTGSSGHGKTTMVAKWIEYLQSSEGDRLLIMYHFAKCLGAPSAEYASIVRRFIQKMMFHCKESGQPQIDLSQLNECLFKWFQKLSTKLGAPNKEKALIIIDGADLIAGYENHFSWIRKPLPANIHVVLTATEDNYPDTWRFLSSPSLPIPTASDLVQLIENIQAKLDVQVLTGNEVTTLACSAPMSSPLWCLVVTRHIISCPSMSSDELNQTIDIICERQELSDLVVHILDELESHYPELKSALFYLLQFVHWSRNGLLVTELEELTSIPLSTLLIAIHELERRQILKDVCGLLYLSHEQMQDAVEMKYCVQPDVNHVLEWSKSLVGLFVDTSRPYFGCRCAEELPWLLKRLELRNELTEVILDITLVVQLYASGNSGDLVSYWQFLDPSKRNIVRQYAITLRKMEDECNDDQLTLLQVASHYNIAGQILRELGFWEEALPLLQRNLELGEAYLDPDGPEVATAMYELAVLYSLSDRGSMAIEFYRQALEILESTYGDDSLQVLKVLERLCQVYIEQNNTELANALMPRVFAIQQLQNERTTASGILKSYVTKLEQFCATQTTETLERAMKMNQLGVILSIYGDPETGEDFLLRSLKSFETLLGEDHIKTAEVMKNLATFYMQYQKLDLAAPLYSKAYAIQLQHFKETDPKVIDTISKLVELNREQGMLDAAEQLQKKIIEFNRTHFGEHHVEVAKSLNNLAVIRCLQQSYTEAIPLYDEAILIYKNELGADHSVVITTINNRQLAKNLLQS